MKPLLHQARAAVLVAAFGASAAALAGGAAPVLSKRDASYLKSMMQAQLSRYGLATLGEKNGASSKIRVIAHRIAAESARETRVLDAIAKSFGMLPPVRPSLRGSYQYSQLSPLHGARFDHGFARAVKTDDNITLYDDEQELRHGSNARLKAVAKRRIPILKAELLALK